MRPDETRPNRQIAPLLVSIAMSLGATLCILAALAASIVFRCDFAGGACPSGVPDSTGAVVLALVAVVATWPTPVWVAVRRGKSVPTRWLYGVGIGIPLAVTAFAVFPLLANVD